MADSLLEILSYKPGSTKLTLRSGFTDTGYSLRGLNPGNAVFKGLFSGPRGTQGARPAAAIAENREFEARLRARGTDKDELLERISAVGLVAESMRGYGGRITWRAAGQTFRQYFEVLGDASSALEPWSSVAEANHRADLVFRASCGIYLLGDPFDFSDDFSSTAGGRYTDDADGGWFIESGVVKAQGGGAQDNEKRILFSEYGYDYGDAQATVKATLGVTVTGFKAGVILQRHPEFDTDYLVMYVDDNGTNSRIRVDRVVGGVPTNLASTNLGSRLSAGGVYWVRGRVEGNVAYAEFFNTAPTPIGAPTTSSSASLSASLFGIGAVGRAGMVWIPKATGSTLDDFRIEAYTYRSRTLPDLMRLYGAIPGDGPALASPVVTPSGGSAAPIFALIGWGERSLPYNEIDLGDFEDDVGRWSVAAVTGVTALATSRTQAAGGGDPGSALQVVCPATLNSGVHVPLYRRFRRGIPYTFKVKVRGEGGATTNCEVVAGVNGDLAVSSAFALTASYVERSVTWTPTADVDLAYVAVRLAAATGTTFRIDCAREYDVEEGEPTLASQVDGRGGYPPFGVIEAELARPDDLSGWAVVSDANYRAGAGIRIATSGVGTGVGSWLIDPNLLMSDELTQGELMVEVWARIELASGVVLPKLTLSARPYVSATLTGAARYTAEFGSLGVSIVRPSSGTPFRFVRLGTLALAVDRTAPTRWRLRLDGSWAATSTGSFGIDHLVVVPAGARACSPTGKANDANYPKFVSSTSETSKTIRSDLSAIAAKPNAEAFPDHGLGGSLIEFPYGNVDAFVKLSSLVPDDPTASSSGELLSHAATVHFAVTPRYQTARGV